MTWDMRYSAEFAWLLYPHSVDEFRNTYYEQRPLFIKRSNPQYFAPLFSLGEVERILYGSELPAHGLRIAKSGQDVLVGSYTRAVQKIDPRTKMQNWTEVVDAYRVSSLFAHGCTIILEDLRTQSEPVANFLCCLERFFCHDMFAASFLTPPDSRGFDVHFDTGENLILQIGGRKRWRVYEPAVELPLEYYQRHDRKVHSPGALLLEVELEPGDILYLPRGTFHEAMANGDTHSLHLTVNLLPLRWHRVLSELLLRAATENVALRRSTAAGIDHDDLVSILLDAISPQKLEEIALELEQAFAAAHRSPLTGQLEQILELRSLRPESVVSLRRGVLYKTALTETATIIESANIKTSLPAAARDIIRALEVSEGICISELLKYDEDALIIVRRLISAGLVVQLRHTEGLIDIALDDATYAK